MQVMQQSLITCDSQALVVQVHIVLTAPAKGETVQFALPAWNPFIQESESRD